MLNWTEAILQVEKVRKQKRLVGNREQKDVRLYEMMMSFCERLNQMLRA